MAKKPESKPIHRRPPMESMMSYGSGNAPVGMHIGPTGSFQLSEDPRTQFNSPAQEHTSNFEGSDLRQQMSGFSGGGGTNMFARKKKREMEGGHRGRSVLARRKGSR